MTKELLEQYPDICAELEEGGQPITDTVTGSYEDYPYTRHSITIRGIPADLRIKRDRLQQQKDEIEAFVAALPPKQMRVVRYRALKGMKWPQVAAKMGYRFSEDGVRMLYARIFK